MSPLTRGVPTPMSSESASRSRVADLETMFTANAQFAAQNRQGSRGQPSLSPSLSEPSDNNKQHYTGLIESGTFGDHMSLARQHFCHAFCSALRCWQPHRNRRGSEDMTGGFVNDDEEEEESTRSARDACVFLPTDTWKERWDILILLFILYSAVTVPYRICFSANATGMTLWAEDFMMVAFIIDVAFTFNLAFIEGDQWVYSRERIAVRYLQGWFWIDAPSAIPVDMIAYLFPGERTEHYGMLRFLRLFRLLRLLRLLKVRVVPTDARGHASILAVPARPTPHAAVVPALSHPCCACTVTKSSVT